MNVTQTAHDHATALTEAYTQYWLLPNEASLADCRHLYQEILALEQQLPPADISAILEQAAAEFHQDTGRCPFCREPGPLHLPPLEEETTHGP